MVKVCFTEHFNGVGVARHVLHSADNGVVNVLFPGFTSVTSARDIEDFARDSAALPPATTILVAWDCGDALAAALKGAIQGQASPARSMAFGQTALLAMVWALLHGAEAAYAEFKKSRDRAERLAAVLPALLDWALNGRAPAKVNLLGHSLGARILAQGLARQSDLGRPLGDVVLLGGATPWPAPAAECSARRLFNLYSGTDQWLARLVTDERCIGKSGVGASVPRLTEAECRGFRHTDYWPALAGLSRVIGFLRPGPELEPAAWTAAPMKTLIRRLDAPAETFFAGKAAPAISPAGPVPGRKGPDTACS